MDNFNKDNTAAQKGLDDKLESLYHELQTNSDRPYNPYDSKWEYFNRREWVKKEKEIRTWLDKTRGGAFQLGKCPFCKHTSVILNRNSTIGQCINPNCTYVIAPELNKNQINPTTLKNENTSNERPQTGQLNHSRPINTSDAWTKELDTLRPHKCPKCKKDELFWNTETQLFECHNRYCKKRFTQREYNSRI